MRAVFLCPGVCHLVALQTVILRCPRTYSGRASVLSGRSVRPLERPVRTVGAHRRRFHGRPRTGHASGVFRLGVRRKPGWRALWVTALTAC